ncbi:hypothetical protein C0J52_25522 [Blattella germanica]|nr:hypothetical protein C0J52_25522 [Blattella germanica]
MPEGTRGIGRPKTRWEDCVRQDVRDLRDTKLEKYSIRQTVIAGASEESQVPHRAVVAMIMMMN